MAGNWRVSGISAQPGETARGLARWPGVGREVPLVLVNGREEGPLTVILGGIHGCEYTSIDAAILLSRLLPVLGVRGRVAVVPVVAMEAYAARSVYVHPLDRKNLNRSLPGDPGGSETDRLAAQLSRALLNDCDYLIDLHGGDMNEALVPFILYPPSPDPDLEGRARDFATAFGIKYIVRGETPGSTYSVAAAGGKVAVLAEAGQQGLLDPAGSDLLVEGTLYALRSARFVPGAVRRAEGRVLVDRFVWTRCAHFGCWYPAVRVGDVVQAGQKAGAVRDLFGDLLQEIVADTAGTVLFCVTSLAINQGDPLFAVGC